MSEAGTDWTPRSGYERLGGYVWLGRVLDKVRQEAAGAPGDYYALDKSPLDQAALQLWRVSARRMRTWVDEGLSDEAIADRLAEAGTGPEAFNRAFLLMWGPVMLVLDADEGRVRGPAAAVLRPLVSVFLGIRQVLVALGVTRAA